MSAADLVRMLVTAALVVALGWVCCDLLLGLIFPNRSPDVIGLPERALGAIGSFVALAVVLMVVNLVTGGAVFGVAAAVPLAGAGLLVYGLLRRAWPSGVPWPRLALLAALLSAVYLVPVVVGGTGARTGDVPWHLGWTEQLLGGQAVPTGPAPEARNAYPWGWHAVLASTARLVPGSDALDAHDTWHLLLVFALPLAAACLGRRVRPDAGWGAATAMSLIGGFGWLAARGPYFATVPDRALYGADLTVASPNGAYALVPPALPRELALVLLGAVGVLLIVAAHQSARGPGVAAGVALGLTGLVSAPMFLAGAAWAAVSALRARHRLRFVCTLLVTAVPLLMLWAGPVAADFVRHGGFVDLTEELGVEWSPAAALSSWGLLLPLAAAGLWLARGSLLPWLVGATSALLVAAFLRKALHLGLIGNATLLHQGRVWPIAHLLAAASAGVALAALAERLSKRSRPTALAVCAALIGVGSISVWMASARMTQLLQNNLQGYTYDRPDLAPSGFARRAAARLSPSDVVAVRGEGGDRLAFLLWQLSGAKLADYDDPERASNDLRIRYKELAERWDRRSRRGGFRPTVIVREVDPPAGEYGNLYWSMRRATDR